MIHTFGELAGNLIGHVVWAAIGGAAATMAGLIVRWQWRRWRGRPGVARTALARRCGESMIDTSRGRELHW